MAQHASAIDTRAALYHLNLRLQLSGHIETSAPVYCIDRLIAAQLHHPGKGGTSPTMIPAPGTAPVPSVEVTASTKAGILRFAGQTAISLRRVREAG